MDEQVDVVVIGGGPSGSTTAHYLARRGRSVLVIERHDFPRYHIGESLTSVSGDVLRDMGLGDKMTERGYPVKPGVKVIGRHAQSEFFVPMPRVTWQVLRSDFDRVLLEHAISSGAAHRHGTVTGLLRDGERVTGVEYQPPDGGPARRVRSHVVIDASGHHAIMSKHHLAGQRQVDAFGKQVAIFSQYRNVGRDPGLFSNCTFIFYAEKHHWAWFIPLGDEVVSIGVVAPRTTHEKLGHDRHQALAWGLDQLNPDLKCRLRGAEMLEPVRLINNYSYRIAPFAGPGWFSVGDAHRFTDPIFSFGVTVALLEGRAAAAACDAAITSGDDREPRGKYVDFCYRVQDAVYDLIRYFWRFPAVFGVQSRSSNRPQLIRLLAGDVFEGADIPLLDTFRQSLGTVRMSDLDSELAREVARRVVSRYSDFQGIDHAYLEERDNRIEITFAIDDESGDVGPTIDAFAVEMSAQFGAALTIRHLPMSALSARPRRTYSLISRRPTMLVA